MYWLLGSVLAICALWYWAGRPVCRRMPLSQVRRSVDSFLVQMAPGGVLMAERAGAAGFLQLIMVGASVETQEVEFGLPDAEWSHLQFDQVIEALQRATFNVTIEPGTSEEVARFARVRLQGPRAALGAEIERLLGVTSAALAWPEGTDVVVWCQGALRKEQGVMPTTGERSAA